MKNYELVVLLHPDLEIDVDTPIAKLEKIIETAGGKVIKRDNWGKKRLAYRVQKQDFAVYVYFEISADPDKVRQLDNSIGLTEEVLRHLIVGQPVARDRKETKKPKAAKTPEPAAVGEEK